jgi:serine phosphatase RsbU (regulator of sigma subunit)
VAVSSQAGLAMDNARLHEGIIELERKNRDIRHAIQVQQSFLPASLPKLAGYEFFAHYKPARDVGGDLYSFVPMANNGLAVGIGDVAGKGVPAALLMARVIAEIRYCVTSQPDAAKAVTSLNTLLQQAGLNEKFVTFLLFHLDTQTHALNVVSAGHFPLYVRRAATGAIEEIAKDDLQGLPLGVLEDYEYQAERVSLDPGDSVFMFTDGLTDAVNVKDEQFGLDNVLAIIRAAPASVKKSGPQLLEAVERHSAGHYQFDDITMVCMGRVG